jgi:hypothetical protein
MSPNHQPSIWPQLGYDLLQHLALQSWGKICESQIAAQNEIERAWDSGGAHIVRRKCNVATMPFHEAEDLIAFLETSRDQIGRQFAQ